ncbi:hypothetical protein FRB94_000357 [Tulasnella sp. JGI-2019a]|nr:hypothetical protein FRB94_000357 [Tulasnella sp. JGI-2019a]
MPRACKSFGSSSSGSTSRHDNDTNTLFRGYVNSLLDAFLIIEGCRHGLIGRLVEKPPEEEKDVLVQSGNVVVWEEEEIGMQRWTDRILWSETRSSGPFLIYREADEVDPSLKYGSNEVIPIPREARPHTGQLEERRKCRYHNRWVTENGLVKKTITIPYGKTRKWHIISYYYVEDILSGRLIRSAQDPALHKLIPTISQCLLVPHLYKKMVLNVAVNPAGRLIYKSEWIAGQEFEPTAPETDNQAADVTSVVDADGPIASEAGPSSTLPTSFALEEAVSAVTAREVIFPWYSPSSYDGPQPQPPSHQQRSPPQPSDPSYELYLATSPHVDNQSSFVPAPMVVDSASRSQVPWLTPQPLCSQTEEQALPSAEPFVQAQSILAPIPTSVVISHDTIELFDAIVSSRTSSYTPVDSPQIPLYPNSASSSASSPAWYHQYGSQPDRTSYEAQNTAANPLSPLDNGNLYPLPNVTDRTEYHF